MNEKEKRELEERFDEIYDDMECTHSFDVDGVCELCGIGSKTYVGQKNKLKTLIFQEISKAEKEARKEALPAFPIMSEDFKKKYRLEGARELAEKLLKYSIVINDRYEKCNIYRSLKNKEKKTNRGKK